MSKIALTTMQFEITKAGLAVVLATTGVADLIAAITSDSTVIAARFLVSSFFGSADAV